MVGMGWEVRSVPGPLAWERWRKEEGWAHLWQDQLRVNSRGPDPGCVCLNGAHKHN